MTVPKALKTLFFKKIEEKYKLHLHPFSYKPLNKEVKNSQTIEEHHGRVKGKHLMTDIATLRVIQTSVAELMDYTFLQIERFSNMSKRSTILKKGAAV